jgi:hypothetical protein
VTGGAGGVAVGVGGALLDRAAAIVVERVGDAAEGVDGGDQLPGDVVEGLRAAAQGIDRGDGAVEDVVLESGDRAAGVGGRDAIARRVVLVDGSRASGFRDGAGRRVGEEGFFETAVGVVAELGDAIELVVLEANPSCSIVGRTRFGVVGVDRLGESAEGVVAHRDDMDFGGIGRDEAAWVGRDRRND